MSCDHKWVLYKPFHMGEPYECCANAGCGITKADYISNLHKSLSIYDSDNNYYAQPSLWGGIVTAQIKDKCPVVKQHNDKITQDVVSESGKKHLNKLLKGYIK